MYLVTGGSGFCGFEIVKYLLARGEKVRVFDIIPLPEPLAGVEFCQVDIRDFEAVLKACRGIDKIIHTVAKVPISKAGKGFWEVNVNGTRNVLEAALQSGIKKVVHISSSAVQMSETNPVPEDAPLHPVGIYAESKLAAEQVCLEYREKGLCVDMIRPRTVLGQGRLGIFDILFDWIKDHANIFIIGPGNNKIQFLFAEDLAKCCYLSAQHAGSETYNIGSRAFNSLREDLGALITYAKSRSKIRSLPVWLTVGTLMLLDKLHLSPLASWHYLTYHKNFYFSNEKALKLLNWQPEKSNFECLCIAYDWFLKHQAEKGKEVTFGTSHRKALKQGILRFIKKLP